MTMRTLLAALALSVVLSPALAQPGPGRGYMAPGHHLERDLQRPMPPADRRMSWEERERLREQVRGGQMTREEAREIRRAERARRAADPGQLSPDERERLRRDVYEANRNLQRR